MDIAILKLFFKHAHDLYPAAVSLVFHNHTQYQRWEFHRADPRRPDSSYSSPHPGISAATLHLSGVWASVGSGFCFSFFAYSGCSTMLWSRFKCDKPYVRGCKYSNNAGNSLPDSVERKTSFFCRRCIVIFYSKHQVPHAPGEHSGRQPPQPALQEDPDPAGSSWHRPRQCHPAHG